MSEEQQDASADEEQQVKDTDEEQAAATGADQQDADGPYTIDNIRDYIVGVDELVELEDGSVKPLINFDNAATTPALLPVSVTAYTTTGQERWKTRKTGLSWTLR